MSELRRFARALSSPDGLSAAAVHQFLGLIGFRGSAVGVREVLGALVGFQDEFQFVASQYPATQPWVHILRHACALAEALERRLGDSQVCQVTERGGRSTGNPEDALGFALAAFEEAAIVAPIADQRPPGTVGDPRPWPREFLRRGPNRTPYADILKTSDAPNETGRVERLIGAASFLRDIMHQALVLPGLIDDQHAWDLEFWISDLFDHGDGHLQPIERQLEELTASSAAGFLMAYSVAAEQYAQSLTRDSSEDAERVRRHARRLADLSRLLNRDELRTGWRQLGWPVDDNYPGRSCTGAGRSGERGLS